MLVQPELLCLSQGTADPGGLLEISLLLLLFGISPSQKGSGAAAAPFYSAPHLDTASVAVREDGACQGFGVVGRKWFLCMKKTPTGSKGAAEPHWCRVMGLCEEVDSHRGGNHTQALLEEGSGGGSWLVWGWWWCRSCRRKRRWQTFEDVVDTEEVLDTEQVADISLELWFTPCPLFSTQHLI